MRAALLVLLLAGPAAAQDLINYGILLDQNRDRVVTTTDASGAETQTLDMGNGVVVTCTDDDCIGVDSGAGAVGCVWSLVSHLRAVAEICNFSDDGRNSIEAVYDRLESFVAENAVPPRSPKDLEVFYRQRVSVYRFGDDGHKPMDCTDEVSMGSGLMIIYQFFTTPSPATHAPVREDDETFDVDAFLATPRLPVMNPCL